jgi:hypothetical protein
VEVAVMPVLLGSGVPLLPPGRTTELVLADQKTLPGSGIVILAYSVREAAGQAPRIAYVKAAKAKSKKRPAKGKPDRSPRRTAGRTSRRRS